MSRILVIEDEEMIQKFLREVTKEKIVTIAKAEVNLLQYEDIMINTDSYEVFKKGEKIELTMKEYQILKLLLEHPNKVFSREYLLKNVWEYDYVGDERVVNTHIGNIRKKLDAPIIETVRGAGYKLVARK